MKRLRVLLLITNLGKGGAQRVFHDHALAFSAEHDVEEAVFDIEQDQRIYNTSLTLHDLRRNDILSKFGPIGRLISRAIQLRRLVSVRKFDIVISHMDGANWVNVVSFSAAKKILVVHGTVMGDANVTPGQQWLRRHFIFPCLYNLAQRTVAVSEGIARELTHTTRVHNACAIPNFFELEACTRMAQQSLDDCMAPIFMHPAVLITSGRLVEQKKQTHLLDILSKLLNRGVKARLVILGDGELRDNLVSKSKTLGLNTVVVLNTAAKIPNDADVYFLGYVSNPFQYLARSTLFLFPSGWEGFPLALCEAMIAGVPVLSSDCPTGPREILSPGTVRDTYDLRHAEMAPNGVLLPMVKSSQDLDVWVNSIEMLLADADQRKKLKDHALLAIKAFNREAVVGQWLKLIEQVTYA